jgi:hypothetical protein
MMAGLHPEIRVLNYSELQKKLVQLKWSLPAWNDWCKTDPVSILFNIQVRNLLDELVLCDVQLKFSWGNIGWFGLECGNYNPKRTLRNEEYSLMMDWMGEEPDVFNTGSDQLPTWFELHEAGTGSWDIELLMNKYCLKK